MRASSHITSSGRLPCSSANSVTRLPSSSGNWADSETSKVSHLGFMAAFSRSSAARLRHSGSAYAAKRASRDSSSSEPKTWPTFRL